MRWKVENKRPVLGQTRERFPFAWWPAEVEDHMVWLEHYCVKEEYMTMTVFDENGGWPVDEWVEIERCLADYYP